jgi:hypothetical protein
MLKSHKTKAEMAKELKSLREYNDRIKVINDQLRAENKELHVKGRHVGTWVAAKNIQPNHNEDVLVMLYDRKKDRQHLVMGSWEAQKDDWLVFIESWEWVGEIPDSYVSYWAEPHYPPKPIADGKWAKRIKEYNEPSKPLDLDLDDIPY